MTRLGKEGRLSPRVPNCVCAQVGLYRAGVSDAVVRDIAWPMVDSAQSVDTWATVGLRASRQETFTCRAGVAWWRAWEPMQGRANDHRRQCFIGGRASEVAKAAFVREGSVLGNGLFRQSTNSGPRNRAKSLYGGSPAVGVCGRVHAAQRTVLHLYWRRIVSAVDEKHARNLGSTSCVARLREPFTDL